MQGSVLALGKCLACLEFMCKYGLELDSHSVNKKKIGILSRILVFCTASSKEEAPAAPPPSGWDFYSSVFALRVQECAEEWDALWLSGLD